MKNFNRILKLVMKNLDDYPLPNLDLYNVVKESTVLYSELAKVKPYRATPLASQVKFTSRNFPGLGSLPDDVKGRCGVEMYTGKYESGSIEVLYEGLGWPELLVLQRPFQIPSHILTDKKGLYMNPPTETHIGRDPSTINELIIREIAQVLASGSVFLGQERPFEDYVEASEDADTKVPLEHHQISKELEKMLLRQDAEDRLPLPYDRIAKMVVESNICALGSFSGQNLDLLQPFSRINPSDIDPNAWPSIISSLADYVNKVFLAIPFDSSMTPRSIAANVLKLNTAVNNIFTQFNKTDFDSMNANFGEIELALNDYRMDPSLLIRTGNRPTSPNYGKTIDARGLREQVLESGGKAGGRIISFVNYTSTRLIKGD